MRLKKIYNLIFICIPFLCFLRCDLAENDDLSSSSLEEKRIYEKHDSSKYINSFNDAIDTVKNENKTGLNSDSSEDIDSLRLLWTWNEKISKPEHSNIKNFKYSRDDLFRDWGEYSDEKFKFSFKIDERSFRPEGLDYKYTINYDSIRIFTEEDWLDGVHRGIITALTKDSLMIKWSDAEETNGVYYSH